MKTLLAFLAVFLFANQALAFDTGNQLLENIRSEQSIRRAASTKYIDGVLEGWIGAETVYGSARPKMFCLPNGLTGGQISDVVKNYLESRPEIRHLRSSILIIEATTNAFPCSN